MLLKNFITLVSNKIDSSILSKNNYISTENMLQNFGGITKSSNVSNAKCTKFEKQDILISNIRPYFKKFWFAQFDGGASNDVLVIRSNNKICLNKYLFYALCSNKFVDLYVANSKGTKMPRGDKNVLLNYNLELPNLIEQQHIVDTIGSIDELIEKYEAVLIKIDYLLLHKFNLLKGDLETSLDNLIQIESGNRPLNKSDVVNNQFCFALYGSSKIMGYCDKWNYDEDVLMIGRVGTLGIVQRTNKKCWISDNVLVIKSKYLNYIQQILKNIDYSSINRGSSQPLITQTDIKKIKVKIPDNNELEDFEGYAKSIQELKYNLLNKIDNLISIKQCLLKKYFG